MEVSGEGQLGPNALIQHGLHTKLRIGTDKRPSQRGTSAPSVTMQLWRYYWGAGYVGLN